MILDLYPTNLNQEEKGQSYFLDSFCFKVHTTHTDYIDTYVYYYDMLSHYYSRYLVTTQL